MKMKLEVNKALVPMKAHYFLWNAGTAPVVPYLSIYARQLGFSSVIVGFIYTVLPVCGMIAKPVFGAIADRFHCQKKIFLFAELLAAAAFLSILYAPKLDYTTTVEFSCLNGETVFHQNAGVEVDMNLLGKIWNKNSVTTCELNCQISSKKQEILCNDWNIPNYCDNSSNDTKAVAFLATVPVDKSINFNGTKIIIQIANITYDEKVFNPVCSGDGIKTNCGLRCNDDDLTNILTNNELNNSDVFRMYQFWIFLLLMVLAWSGQAVTVSIGDAICFEMLGDKPNRYGYQRMYGALGWGILSVFTGFLVNILSKNKSYTDYTAAFYLAAFFILLDFFTSCILKYKQTKMSTNIFKDVGKLIVNIRIVVFLIWCISVGMCTGLMWQFFLWLVQDSAESLHLDNIQTLQGILMGVQCLGGELPFFFLSGKILKKIGHVTAMSLVLFALGIRFILYSVIRNPWYFIPIEFSNGLTFGLFYACMASYASIVAPPGTEATMQGMVGAVFEGVGVSLGSFLAGLALAKVSGSLTFRYFGIGALVACALHIGVQKCLQLRDSVRDKNRKNSFEKVRPDDRRELTSVEPLMPR